MTSDGFVKYHGTGNDFIVFDNRSGSITFSAGEIARLCHRRFGIGADGLMLLLESPGYDFGMKYYNSDGNEGTMCGNGGRCIAAFAHDLGIVRENAEFTAIDGVHRALVKPLDKLTKLVEVSLRDVLSMEQSDGSTFVLDTGSPHYVAFVDDLDKVDVLDEGRKIRWDDKFRPGGINVNFVEQSGRTLKVGTFERGVEDVTLSCGTGVTAAAIAASAHAENGLHTWHISTLGGELWVTLMKENGHYRDIWLKGPAERVFAGTSLR